jgi:hypothetical protein
MKYLDVCVESTRQRSEHGASLLELLLSLAVFMSMMPFVYRFAMDRKEQAANMAIVSEIEVVRNALEQYVAANKQKLLAPMSANVVRVKQSDLENIPPRTDRSSIQLRVVKSKDSAGRSFVQGIVIFDEKSLTPLRTRQIALSGGQEAGFADGNMLHGAFGTWRTPLSAVDAVAGGNSILAQTRPFRSGGDYLQRLPSSSPLDATLQSDLDMGGHNVSDTKSMTAASVRFLDTLTANSIEISRMTVANRLDWTAGINVFGDALVNGPIISDGRSVDAARISVAGDSHFRSVSTDELRADNLYLSGFSVGSQPGSAPILSISGTLDLAGGHVKAMDTIIAFSGSVAPKLVVSGRIEDSADGRFHWDMSGEAVLGDLLLTDLNKLAKIAYSREKTGMTETERIMGPTFQNANATAADFLRALNAATKAVESKYQALE